MDSPRNTRSTASLTATTSALDAEPACLIRRPAIRARAETPACQQRDLPYLIYFASYAREDWPVLARLAAARISGELGAERGIFSGGR
jgi:hypothetical protein